MNEAEQIVANCLADRRLRAQRFAKNEIRAAGKKTPDFRVFKGNAFQFYCEVKETTDADPLQNHMRDVGSGVRIAEQRKVNDISRHSRFANRIRGAVEQFDSVNPDLEHPNVLAFVNTDNMCAPAILEEVLQGYFIKGYPFRACPASLTRRAQTHGVRVHLFLWVNQVQSEHFVKFFPWIRTDDQTMKLVALFPEVREILKMANNDLNLIEKSADRKTNPQDSKTRD